MQTLKINLTNILTTPRGRYLARFIIRTWGIRHFVHMLVTPYAFGGA